MEFNMDINVGTIDRTIRIIIGLALLAFFLLSADPLCRFGLVGIVPLLTGAYGRCPLYRMVGLSTCGAPRDS